MRGPSPKGTVPGTVPSLKSQRGYLLITVVVALFLLATVAVLLSHDSAISANTSSSELEAARVEYVAQAGLQHALWRTQNNVCMGDITIPATTLGSDTYDARTTGAKAGTAHVLSADQDAWIRSDDVTKNNSTGADQHIRFESGNTEHALTRFDLSSLPENAQINSATARFYVSTGGASGGVHPEGPISIHRVTADWTETGATWETMGGKFETSTLATIPAQDQSGVWVSFNLTGQVQAWANGQPNYGILMRSVAEGVHGKYSSREDGSNAPRLEVVVGSGVASPVTIKATGTLANGVKRNLNDNVAIASQPPGTVTLQLGTDPGADAMLDSFYPRNYGAQDFVQVIEKTGNWVQRPVFQFGLGRVPAHATVLSAQLELRMRSIKTPGTATVHRITRGWVEGTKYGTGTADGATWATYDGINSWASEGGDFDAAVAEAVVDSSSTWVEWHVAPLVRGWMSGEPNYGLLLKSDGVLEEAEFYSKEQADPTLRPKLTIGYACECSSACMAPQGSGNLLMVVDDANTLGDGDLVIKSYFESWGYTVTLISDHENQNTYDAAFAANDVVFVSDSVDAIALSTKLSTATIGIVSASGDVNNELGIASNKAEPVSHELDVIDTDHYITRIFPAGELKFKTVDTELTATSGTKSPDAKVLATAKDLDALVALESGGVSTKGGTVNTRRVLIPVGDSDVSWSYLTNAGQLIVQRSLAWAMGADDASSGKLLLVVGNAASPATSELDRKALIESWGYTVTLIDDDDSQANFDTAMAANDVAYIAGSGSSTAVGTKLTGATIGVLSEDIGLVDELGIAEPAFLKKSSQSINVIDNTHYVTDGFGLGTLQLYTYLPQIWTVTGALAPGLHVLGETQDGGSSYPTGLAVLETGAGLWGGGSAAGRRVQVAWSEGSFDINGLNDDGKTIFRRAIEWGAGAGAAASSGYNVLLIVGDDTTLASKDVGYKALMESWGHTVAVIDDGASQTDYDAAMAAADVIYASGSALGSNMLNKATYTTKGLVNEVSGKLDNFGFSSSTTYTFSADTFANSDAAHYISSPFSGAAINALTTFLNMPIPGGTLAPGLEFPASFTGFERGVVTLDAGATGWDGSPAPARRVHLPFAPATVDELTLDGKTLIKRAIEWGAAAGSSQQEILLVVADATNLSAQDIARQTLMADWGYQVATISASDSQANFDAAVATASAAYVVMQNSSTALGTKLRDATIAVINEEVELRAEIGFAANRDWPTTRDTVDIIVDSHYITSPFSPGLLTIATTPIEVVTLSGQMAGGLLVLGQQDWGGLQNSLSVIDTGGALYGGGNAAGRRVQLPWGRVGFDINNLNADGLTIMRRAIEWGIAGGGGGGGGSGTTVTLFPTKDTFVGGNSTAVYGGNASLFMGFGSREWRPVLQFDVSGIPTGSTVTSAKLRLHNWDDGSASAGPLTVTAYGVEQAWTETWGNKGANWYDRAKQGGGALQWSTPGVSYSTGDSAIATFDSTAAPQWVEWEVAPLVQGWIDGASTNNGIVLVPDAGSAWANSHSADYGDAALHPQLVVTYE